MNTRQIALAAAFLALVFLAHAAGRFAQIGGAQIALSIAVYTLMGLLMAPSLGWGALVGIALGVGILTMLATSSPVPWANIPGHGGGFLVGAWLAKRFEKGAAPLGLGTLELILAITTNVAWVLFALFTWWGISPASGFHERAFERFGMAFGSGFLAWFLFGFVGVVIPTWIFGAIVLPLLYRAVRPAMIRQGMAAGA